MAFVRFLGRLGTTPAMRINLSNRNGHQLATSRLLSSTPLLSAAVQKPLAAPKDGGKKDQLDTSFSDPIAAFKSKTTFELIRGYLVYLICSSETLVENNMKVSLLMSYVVHSLDGRRVETDLRHCDSFVRMINISCPNLKFPEIYLHFHLRFGERKRIIDFSLCSLFLPMEIKMSCNIKFTEKSRLHDASFKFVYFT